MISDKQFDDAFTAAGGWFFLTQFELIKSWAGSKAELVNLIYSKGFDAKKTGSSTRVSGSLRIIGNGRGKEALIKIRDSKSINRRHPEAERMASKLLSEHFA
jgi:hypothetical protein